MATRVASIIEKSYAMFASFKGNWLPFGLMFLTTYLVGRLVLKRQAGQVTA